MSHHDASYERLSAALEVVRDSILGFVPDDWLHRLGYARLEKVPGSYVSKDLRHRANDVVWRVRVDETWVCLAGKTVADRDAGASSARRRGCAVRAAAGTKKS